MPSQAEPVVWATANPATAPMTIMPSTPRLSTPERSTTSSPSAAIRSGVAAVAIVRSIASNIVILRAALRRCIARTGHNPDAIINQGVTGEDKKQDDALEDACRFFRNTQ